MPFTGTFNWKAQAATPINQQLAPTVSYIPNNSNYQALTACADPAKLLPRTTGGQLTEYRATTGTSTTSGTVARQFIFFFSDDASAQQTFTWLQSQYSSACLVSGPTVRVTNTGGDGTTSAAWLTVKTSKSGPVDLSPYNREYFVLRGSTIAYVEVEATATLPTTYDDAAQISAIASHLCVYGGFCDRPRWQHEAPPVEAIIVAPAGLLPWRTLPMRDPPLSTHRQLNCRAVQSQSKPTGFAVPWRPGAAGGGLFEAEGDGADSGAVLDPRRWTRRCPRRAGAGARSGSSSGRRTSGRGGPRRRRRRRSVRRPGRRYRPGRRWLGPGAGRRRKRRRAGHTRAGRAALGPTRRGAAGSALSRPLPR